MPFAAHRGLLRAARLGDNTPPYTPPASSVLSSLVAGNWGVAIVPGHADTELYVERTGASATTLCTDNTPVGTIRNIPLGLNLMAASDAQRPVYRSVSGVSYLQTDGVSNLLNPTLSTRYTGDGVYMIIACRFASGRRMGSVALSTSGGTDSGTTGAAAMMDNEGLPSPARNFTIHVMTANGIVAGEDAVLESFVAPTSATTRKNNLTDQTASFASFGAMNVNRIGIGSQANGDEPTALRIYAVALCGINALPSNRAELRTFAAARYGGTL